METNPKRLIKYRKQLRTYGTPSEATLWVQIRNRQLDNIRFRRQFGIDRYILDFYAPEIKLSIELDGNVLKDGQVDEHDYYRPQFILAQGITELRFENDKVQFNMDEVLETIKYTIRELKKNTGLL